MYQWTTGASLVVISALTWSDDDLTQAAPVGALVPSSVFNGGFMMDARRNIKNALDAHGRLQIRIQPSKDDNSSWVGVIEDAGRGSDDDIGALYYVVAVIFIYGLSIVMMIASHIRKNKQDSQLRTYLKEMANLRKTDRREKVLSKMNDIAKRHKNQEAKQKKVVNVKDTAGDSELEKEVCQLMSKKDEDNTDSVFLPPEFCISPVHPKRLENPSDKLSDVGSCRNPSISSRGSGRNNSISSNLNSNVPSANQSPALSESRYDVASDRQEQHRLRSPNFQDFRRWRRGENRSYSGHDYRTVRIQDRLSPNFSEKRSACSPSDSLNEFRISLQPGQERSSTSHEPRIYSWNVSSTLTPTNNLAPPFNAKCQRSSDMKQTLKVLELKQNPPASFHVVDEDAIL